MKLGYIRMSDRTRDFSDQLGLAGGLGFDQVYLPSELPQRLAAFLKAQPKHLKFVLDATAFGSLAPCEMEKAVRAMDYHLGGCLRLGVNIDCDSVSAKTRADAQKFETIFSHHPNHELNNPQSRYPMKLPRPEIVGFLGSGSRAEASLAAARGYLPATPSWLAPGEVARHWPAIVVGATSALRRADPSHWQLARTIVVHDDPGMIEDYVYGAKSPIRQYSSLLAKRGIIPADVDAHLRCVVITGTAEQVAEKILALKEAVGDFGMLNMIDHSQSDQEITRRTMISLAEKIMPMVNKTQAIPTKELETI